ncbi:hypothetical protein BW10_02080 [Bifidobacterium sp. UTBIF-56]|nr:hypothetical protein BW07_05155 [Bifidobacterium sp. UTCIF-36]TPF91028.1 hypothetical protein BW10_02080 [Bifidobacterium sp. UTBIF-56]
MNENAGKTKKRAVNTAGPTGKQVAANVARLRGGMQYKELAEKLTELGRPIAPLGLRRIESGERKVDVDDLMALAIAFDVSPLTLLLPESGSNRIPAQVTGVQGDLTCAEVWRWAVGAEPLPGVADDSIEAIRFRERSAPRVIEETDYGLRNLEF